MMQTDAQHIQCSQKHKKLIADQFSRSKSYRLCGGTSHKALERLAFRVTLRFSQLAVKELIFLMQEKNLKKKNHAHTQKTLRTLC
jgi:hypothetical protein